MPMSNEKLELKINEYAWTELCQAQGKLRLAGNWLIPFLGLVGLVYLVWFGLVNEDDFNRPQVPLKVGKVKLELQFGTIPGQSGPVRVGPVQEWL